MTPGVRMALLVGTAPMLLPAVAAAQVYVNPYVRRDGTQVEGHYRSALDGNPETYLRGNNRERTDRPYSGWSGR